MRYGTIVLDPPWRYQKTRVITTKGKAKKPEAANNYPTMSRDEVAALPVGDLAAKDAHLYLWVTTPLMFSLDVLGIVEGWGFTYFTTITWVKKGAPGVGFWFRGDTEHCVFAARGNSRILPADRKSNVITAAKTGHSKKPDALGDLIESVSPGPYLEMFARRNRLGWSTWGNEALNHIEVAT